jgi:hypothetical protein
MSHDGTDERRSRRDKVHLAATLAVDGQRSTVRILDLSEHGALVRGSLLPAEETEVSLEYRQTTKQGWVVWKRQDFAGVHFHGLPSQGPKKSSLSTSDMIVKDTREVDYKRPGFRGDLLSSEEKRLLREWLKGD